MPAEQDGGALDLVAWAADVLHDRAKGRAVPVRDVAVAVGNGGGQSGARGSWNKKHHVWEGEQVGLKSL